MATMRSKPKPPANVSCSGVVISTADATTAIDVSWPTPPGQGQPVLGFIVYRNGAEVASVSAAVRSWRDLSADYGLSVSYGVAVVSAALVESTQNTSNATLRPRRPTLAVPSTLSAVTDQVVNFSAYASDDDTLSYTLTVRPDSGYAIGASSGLGTIGASSGNMVVRAADQSGLYTDATCAVTVASAEVTAATYTIGMESGVVTVRRVSDNSIRQTGSDLNAETIGAVAGDILEFKTGTYPKMRMYYFKGTAAKKITFRVAAGGLMTQYTGWTDGTSGFRWEWRDCCHCTIDGSTTNASASLPILHLPAPARCGIKLTGTGTCTGWIKLTVSTTSKKVIPSGMTWQFIEIAGPGKSGIAFQYNLGEGRIGYFPNQWVEDTTIRYCYWHHTGGAYMGNNYEANEVGGLELPLRRTTIEYCRSTNTTQECATLKQHWEGPNYLRYNWFENSGSDLNNPPQRAIGGCQNSTAIIHNNFLFFSAQGLSGYAQAGEYGHGSHTYNGPDKTRVPSIGTDPSTGQPWPSSYYDSYGPFPYFEVEYYNNVIVDSGESGIRIAVLAISPSKAPGVTELPRLYYKIYNNTVVRNGLGGTSFGGIDSQTTDGNGLTTAWPGSFVRNNISIDNVGSNLVGAAATLGSGLNKISGDTRSTLFVSPDDAVYTSRNYRLKKAVPVAAGSTLGVNVAATDITGKARSLSTANMGAYEL